MAGSAENSARRTSPIQGAEASPRIERLRQALRVDRYPLCIDHARLVTESFKQTEGQPQIIRRAKALANVLEKIVIFIQEGELIVGNAASKPMGVNVHFWHDIWPEEGIRALKKEGFDISESEISELLSMNTYWKGKGSSARMAQLFDEDRLWPFAEAGIHLPPWTSRDAIGGGRATGGLGLGPGGLWAPDYTKLLKEGLGQVIQDAGEELARTQVMKSDAAKKRDYLTAVIVAHKAIIRFAGRFSVLAQELASKESKWARKQELEEIGKVCQWVPANPARTFHEAIQSFWFMYLMTSSVLTTNAIGRFDQYAYPFLKKDKEEGRLTDEQALELLQCLRIKDMQINYTSASQKDREKWSGLAKWHNMIVGGQTPDGQDATNELSYLVLEAAKRCPTPHHTLTVRVHDGTPELLLLRALEVVRTGIGMPAFIGDKSYIDYLLSQGVPLKDARDYMLGGCLDVNVMGKSRILAINMFIIPLVFDLFLHNGIHPLTGKRVGPPTPALASYETFEEFMGAWKEYLRNFMQIGAEFHNIQLQAYGEVMPDPVASPLFVDGIEAGKDLTERTLPYENAAALNAVGMINVADSLAAIKKLVFDERRVTWQELQAALDANWEGERNQEIRKMCLSAPKFGNDDDSVDAIAQELYRHWAEETVKLRSILGGSHKPAGISITSHAPGGALTGATPDGRCAGEPLADGTMSPMRGMDTHGPLASLKSAAKIDQVPFQSTLLNSKFHPSALKTTEDLRKLSHLIRTYFSMGGKHIQFNVVSREKLIDAQKHPENYRDLVVRMAGYSAYFVQLSKVTQDDIIARTEHQSIA